ncbi:MAG: hypothetical protein GXZ00_02380 [Synergistaceae bacterium]|nr:hypothetical protein [Synergistaceae bacterium]
MIEEIRELLQTKKLVRLALLSALIWTVGIVLFAEAAIVLNKSKDRLLDTGKILNAANIYRSYPSRTSAEGKEPLSALSDAIEELSLKDRAGLVNSGPSGLTVQITELNGAEFISFFSLLSKKGLQVKTAEIRAITSPQKGRLINASILIGVNNDASL